MVISKKHFVQLEQPNGSLIFVTNHKFTEKEQQLVADFLDDLIDATEKENEDEKE